MNPPSYNVLFISPRNALRSIFAEAILTKLAGCESRFKGFSAGSQPTPWIYPIALDTLQRHQLPTTGLRPKSWNEFTGPRAPWLDFVFILGDQGVEEAFPMWPGYSITARWTVPNPLALPLDESGHRQAVEETFMSLWRRIELFIEFPIEKLDKRSLQQHVNALSTLDILAPAL